jgi:hypothetical protein
MNSTYVLTSFVEGALECTSSLALLGALSRCALEFRIISKSSSANIVPTFMGSTSQSEERIQAPAAEQDYKCFVYSQK